MKIPCNSILVFFIIQQASAAVIDISYTGGLQDLIAVFLFVLGITSTVGWYLFHDIWYMYASTKHATKNKFSRKNGKAENSTFVVYAPVERSLAELNGLHVQWVSKPFTLAQSFWYFCTITLNFQLNNVWRLLELIWRWPSAESNTPISHADVYQFIMDTAIHMWIRSEDEHVHFENVMLPIGRNGWRGGTSAKVFESIIVELDHSTKETSSLTMDDQRTTNAMEIISVLAAIEGVYVHPQIHMIGAEAALLDNWPLAGIAGVAMNGLNFAVAEDLATRRLLIGPLAREILQHNLLQGMPHFKRGCAPRCLEILCHSALYDTIKAAHNHPGIRKYAGSPFEVAALVNILIIHPVDHYVVGKTVPRFLDSSLLDSNFTILRVFAAEVNHDITLDFSTPWDDAGRVARELLCKHAPHLVGGFKAIPNN